MDEIENKNLQSFIDEVSVNKDNNSRVETIREIKLMQKFIQRVVYLDALSKIKMLNLFDRSKWNIEIEFFLSEMVGGK